MQVAELTAKFGLVPDKASWDKGHELLESLHHAVEAWIGVESIKKVGELVSSTVEAAVQAKHLGERLGITGEAVQELGYAADVTGASAEDMTTAMQRLSMGMEHAKKSGSGPLVDAFHQLHLNFQQVQKLPLDQRMEVIADAFANAGPGVDKLALSMEIFGRNAGPKLLPLLEKSGAGIRGFREDAEKLGSVIDEEGIQKAEEFEIAQKKLGATLKGVRNEAVVAILPALQEMTEGLSAWVAQNREAIASTLKAVLEGLAAAFHVVGMVIGTVVDVVKYLGDNLDVLIPILAGVAAILLPMVAEWAAGMVIAAGATIVAIAPFVAIGAAVAALALGIMKLIQHWREVVDWIKSKGADLLGWFESIPGEIAGALSDLADFITAPFRAAFDWIEAKIDYFVDKAKSVVDTVKGFVDTGDTINGQKVDASAIFTGGSVLVPSVAEGAGPDAFSAGVQATFGDTNIQIAAANMTPEELKGAVKDSVREAQQDALRLAYSNLSGGKR